jgi:hypothetical protein
MGCILSPLRGLGTNYENIQALRARICVGLSKIDIIRWIMLCNLFYLIEELRSIENFDQKSGRPESPLGSGRRLHLVFHCESGDCVKTLLDCMWLGIPREFQRHDVVLPCLEIETESGHDQVSERIDDRTCRLKLSKLA